LTHKLRKGI